jgi:hypothetical protein
MPTLPAVIVNAKISKMPVALTDPMPQVEVVFDDGTTCSLFSYYPDEISFTPEEFIGLTRAQAMHLRHKKDVAYLQS